MMVMMIISLMDSLVHSTAGFDNGWLNVLQKKKKKKKINKLKKLKNKKKIKTKQ